MDLHEQQLIEKAQQGDAAAMEALLARYEKQVYRFGLRMCGSEDAAKEVLQQTLLTAFKSLRSFRGQAQLSTWLYQIARSFCGKTRRRRADEPAMVEALETPEVRGVASDSASPEELAHGRKIGELLQAAIAALPEAQREVLILRDVEGLTADEAAKVLEIEVANLKTRLHRARAALREHLSVLLEPGDAGGECRALSDSLADFAAADIEKATCEQIEAHLATCERCAQECQTLQKTVSLCRRIPGDAVPPPVKVAVRRALEQALAR